MSDADETKPPTDDDIINLANRLLSEFSIETVVTEIEDIGATLFVVLFEALFSEKLPGIIRQPQSREDEIHNCQIVIDVLQTDIIRDSLGHINGLDVVNGNGTMIYNLLDIFSYLFEYYSVKIDSDAPTDIDESQSVLSEGFVTNVPGKGKSMEPCKLAKARENSPLARTSHTRARTIPKNLAYDNKDVHLNTNENQSQKDYNEIFPLNRCSTQRAPSPIKPDDSQSFLGYKTIDSEFSIDNLDKKGTSPSAPPASPKITETENGYQLPEDKADVISTEDINVHVSQSDPVDQRLEYGRTNFSFTHHLYHHYDFPTVRHEPLKWADELKTVNKEDNCPRSDEKSLKKSYTASFFNSLPASKSTQKHEDLNRLYSTVGPIPYTPTPTPDKYFVPSEEAKGFSSSLDDLRHLVEKTAAMTRFALESSPVRSKTMQELDLADSNIDQPRPNIPGDGARLAKELNSMGLNGSYDRNFQAASRGEKKVAFAPTNLRSEYEYERSPLTALSHNSMGYSSDCSSDNLYEDEADFRYNINHKKMSYGDSMEDKIKPQRRNTTRTKISKEKTPSLVTHLARNRQPELGAAHMTLKTEDRALTRKQNILKKMYDEDLEEFTEEVKHMMDKSAKKSQETEELFKKKCRATVNAKNSSKLTKGKFNHSRCKKPRIGNSNSKKQLCSASEKDENPPAVSPWHLESEEDLLPLLLEEFPHLHLSEHTWHELWRRGLNQIQSLTNAYAKARGQRSREQSQLEEAAQRHEKMGNLMKKQLDHSKRLREIKEQKQFQAQLKNKAHEQKIQSARARNYYNEYQVRARGKQLKRRTKEEMVFRDLFKEALDIQKERIKDIRKYASDQRKRQESRRQNEIDSMENFYRDQFDMLSERLSKERYETEVRDTAQKKMLGQMKRELRKKMESEIRSYQDNILKDDDQAHWRRADAEKVKQQLHLARYSAKI